MTGGGFLYSLVLLFTSHTQGHRLDELCCLQPEQKTKGDDSSPKHEFPWHSQTPVQNPLDGSKLTFVSIGEKCTCEAKHSSVQSSYAGERETLKPRDILPSGHCRQGETGSALTSGSCILHAPWLLLRSALPAAQLAPLHSNGPDTLVGGTSDPKAPAGQWASRTPAHTAARAPEELKCP